MKYLKSRTLFIENRRSYSSNLNKNQIISEALKNDITWGDSLVGRLMASIFRMGKLGIDIIGIKGLLTKLENVINESTIESLSNNNERFNEVKEKVKKKSIKEGIVDTIQEKPTKTIDVIDEYIEEYGDDYIYTSLNELPDNIKAIIKTYIKNNIDSKYSNIDTSLYKNIIKNLQSIKGILNTYESIEIEGVNNNNNNNNNNNKDSKDDINNIINNIYNNKIDNKEKYLKILKNRISKENNIDTKKSIKKAINKLETISESILIHKNETNLITSFNKIKKSIEVLKSSNEKGLSIDDKLITDILTNSKNTETKKILKSIYNNVYLYNIGKNIGVSNPDKLYENINTILDKSNMTFSEKLSRFIKRSLQFEGENFYAPLGDLGKYLKEFNTTINYIFDSIENNNDNKITGNNTILDKIKDDSDNKYEVIDDVLYLNDEKVDIKEIIDNTDDEINKEIEEDLNDLKNVENDAKEYAKDSTIDMLEVVRIFSKANKKMVVNNIPSVRTNGKISVARSNNYEKLDGGSVNIDNTGSGPFRNKKLFNTWNDGVLKIMSKYKDILKNANIYDQDGNKIKPKYPITKFMSDALDDGKLFSSLAGRSGGQGYQSKYLDEYFGVKTDDLKDNKNFNNTDIDIKKDEKIESVQNIKFNNKINRIYIDGDINGTKINNKELYLIFISNNNGNNLCKISTSDNFLKAYNSDYYPKYKTNNKIFFTELESLEIGNKVNKLNIIETKGWENNKVNSINIDRVRKIEILDYDRKLNNNRLKNDIYPKESISKIIDKLK